MFNKKILIFSVLFLAFIAISAVNAADNSTNNDLSIKNTDLKIMPETLDITQNDNSYKIQPNTTITNSEDSKAPVKIYCDSFTSKIGSKKYISAYVYTDSDLKEKIQGKALFKINGKIYSGDVKDGMVKVKVKLPLKAKTYKCQVIYLGDKNYQSTQSTFNIKLSDSNTVILKNNRKLNVGKYKIKLSKKQYVSLIKAFNKDKSKSIKINTKYTCKFTKPYLKKINKYKILRTVKTFGLSYIDQFNRMKNHGWKLKSEYVFTKKNPLNKEGIGLSEYTYSISKWVKSFYKKAYKTKYFPVCAKIVIGKSSAMPTIKIYAKNKILFNKFIAIA